MAAIAVGALLVAAALVRSDKLATVGVAMTVVLVCLDVADFARSL